jgi:hypothetical protein
MKDGSKKTEDWSKNAEDGRKKTEVRMKCKNTEEVEGKESE